MKALKIELLMEDDADAEYFVTQVLPKLVKTHGIERVVLQECELR